MTDTLGLILGFLFTLLLFSYLLGDNVLYRFAVYVLVGLAAAFVTIAVVEGVLWPLTRSGEGLLLILAFIFSVLLLFKITTRLTWLSNVVMAFILAVGAAVAMAGAAAGTLLPLSLDVGDAVAAGPAEGLIVLVGVVTSLLYFQYMARRSPQGEVGRGRLMTLLAGVGQGFIVVTLGVLYAGAILTSLTILTERIGFLLRFGG